MGSFFSPVLVDSGRKLLQDYFQGSLLDKDEKRPTCKLSLYPPLDEKRKISDCMREEIKD